MTAAMTETRGEEGTTQSPPGDTTADPPSTTTSTDATADDTAADESTGGGLPQGVPFVYVGTNAAVHIYSLDAESGALTPVGDPVDAGPNPSFLAVDPDRRVLLAVNETGNFGGEDTGAVASFAIDQTTGGLTFLSRVSSQGSGPAHVSTDATGSWALVANYGGGTAAVLPIGKDGVLGDAVDVEDHGGSANSHQIRVDANNAYAYVPNLGLNSTAQYAFDTVAGSLTALAPAAATAPSGGGPRHLEFHPSLDVVYVINELGSTMDVFGVAGGALSPVQNLSTLPRDYDGQNFCADVHVHPSGDFLYGSNRGHHSIVVYAVDAAGMLSVVDHVSTGGEWPRNFEVSPDGSLMLVANQQSDTIVAFSIDPATGVPAPTGEVTKVGAPAFVGIVYLPGA